jgi:hypothetical protein
MAEEFRFAPGLVTDCSGNKITPSPVQIDTPVTAKPATTGDDKPFVFAPGLARKAASVDHHDDEDCHCGGDCSDCAKKTAALYFSPGTKIRHKLTGKIYKLVSTTCVTPDDCSCVLERPDGTKFEAAYYPGEVERVA